MARSAHSPGGPPRGTARDRLDTAILAPAANDFAAFFARQPAVRTVFFNGTKARALWARHVALAPPSGLEPELVTLPSTSPANAALSFEGKLAAWQVVGDAAASG